MNLPVTICPKCTYPQCDCALAVPSNNNTDGLRDPLARFAALMEQKLRKNDHKTSWRDLPIEALFRQAMLEIEEFKVADEFLSTEEARREAVDIANFFLILHDRLGMLPRQDQPRKSRANQESVLK